MAMAPTKGANLDTAVSDCTGFLHCAKSLLIGSTGGATSRLLSRGTRSPEYSKDIIPANSTRLACSYFSTHIVVNQLSGKQLWIRLRFARGRVFRPRRSQCTAGNQEIESDQDPVRAGNNATRSP